MKKMISLIFIISIISLSGQELTEKDFPSIGSNGLYRSFLNFSLKNPADRSGKDVEWDYSTIPSSQGLLPVYWSPLVSASEDLQKEFPNATYLIEGNTNNWPVNFYKIEDNTHVFMGYSFNGQSYKFKEPVKYYTYPMEFGETLESEFVFEDESFGSGIFSITYDAFGSIMIPELKFDDVYRLKLETKTVFPDTPNDTVLSVEYQYYQKGTGQLLLRLTELGPSDTEGRLNYSYIYFVEKETSVNAELSVSSTVYPNPTQSELRLIIPNHTIVNYEIYNQLGVVVGSGEYNDLIDVKSLNSGSYFIKAELENNQYIMKKFIKE